MEPIYGNYLGIVINNEDPEERKRVQVFIPHLSNTLFSDWNNRLEDFAIRSPLDLGDKIVTKLKQLLPWAEAAAPIFGGSTGMTANTISRRLGVNNDNYTFPAGTGGLAIDPLAPFPGSDLAPTVEPDLPPLSPPEGGEFTSPDASPEELPIFEDYEGGDVTAPLTSSSDGNPLEANLFFSKISEDRKKYFNSEISNSEILNRLTFLAEREVGNNVYNQTAFTETVFNRAFFTGKSLSSILGDPNKDNEYWGGRDAGSKPITKTTQNALNNVLNGSNFTNMATDNASNDYKNDNPVANRRIEQGVTGVWFNNGGEVNRDGGEFYYRSNSGKYTTTAGINATKYAESNGIEGIVSSTSPENNFINPQLDARNENIGFTPNSLTSASGSPNGTLSVPNAGAKVWVFFYGGDIQKPIYFASAIEPTT